VYKDVLQGAGVLDALLAALTDAAITCDLRLLQEMLWTLVALADDDDDFVYKELFREKVRGVWRVWSGGGCAGGLERRQIVREREIQRGIRLPAIATGNNCSLTPV